MDQYVNIAVSRHELIGLGCVLSAAGSGDAETNARGPVIVHNADASDRVVRPASVHGAIGKLEIGVRDSLASQTNLRREDR